MSTRKLVCRQWHTKYYSSVYGKQVMTKKKKKEKKRKKNPRHKTKTIEITIIYNLLLLQRDIGIVGITAVARTIVNR